MPSASAQSPTSDPRALVLVVDDDAVMNRFLAENLAARYRVETAVDGEEGLRKAIELRPDVILTDMIMPRMSGEDLLREVRKRPALARVAVVLLSAVEDRSLRVRALKEGAHDYILKPVFVDELLARVGNLVAIKRSRELLQEVSESQQLDIESLSREVAARKRELEVALAAAQTARTQAETELCERKAAEVALRRAEEHARHTQKMEAVGRLASGIAHDFNNLLIVINGTCDLLLGRLGEDDPLRRDVEQIRKAGERSTSLTRQLLAISRRQQTALAPLASIEVVTTLSPRIGKVLADAGQFEQVIMNLAINARDAMPRDGKLTIETSEVDLDDALVSACTNLKPGRYVLLAVTDTGCGMDENTRARIFEPFFTTKGPGVGTGLGLSIVYGIVKQSGGCIWVYSEVGKGTTFKVYLPRAGGDTRIIEPPAETTVLQPRTGGSTILLVEDEDVVRLVVREFLAQAGHTVLSAPNAEEALVVARAHPGAIDLLLTDMGLPRKTGQELAAEMSTLRPETRALLMTGYTETTANRGGASCTALPIIQKPFDAAALLKKVGEVLR